VNALNHDFFNLQQYSYKIPGNVLSYINDAALIVRNLLGKDKLKGIILFGSYARAKSATEESSATKISDVDLIFKIDDSVSNSELKRVDGLIDALAIKYGLRMKADSLFNKFLRAVEKTTGMFVSHFFVRNKYWKAQKFSKVFRLNSLLSALLAPCKLVLKSMSFDCITLWGEGLDVQDSIKIPKADLFRSMLMNFILCLAGNFLGPFVKTPEMYVLESVKWSIRACYFYITEKIASVDSTVMFFKLLNRNNPNLSGKRSFDQFLDDFLRYRSDHNRTDVKFRLKACLAIIKIHCRAIQYAIELDKDR